MKYSFQISAAIGAGRFRATAAPLEILSAHVVK
jgi:hypothetical protein